MKTTLLAASLLLLACACVRAESPEAMKAHSGVRFSEAPNSGVVNAPGEIVGREAPAGTRFGYTAGPTSARRDGSVPQNAAPPAEEPSLLEKFKSPLIGAGVGLGAAGIAWVIGLSHPVILGIGLLAGGATMLLSGKSMMEKTAGGALFGGGLGLAIAMAAATPLWPGLLVGLVIGAGLGWFTS